MYLSIPVKMGFVCQPVKRIDVCFLNVMNDGIPANEYFEVVQELQNHNPMLDIAEQDMSDQAKSLIDSWSYHFATVVGKDGGDMVTLENYNRGVENENNIRDIFHKLLTGFEEYNEEVQEMLSQGNVVKGKIRYNTQAYHKLIQWMANELPQIKDNLSLKAQKALKENHGYAVR